MISGLDTEAFTKDTVFQVDVEGRKKKKGPGKARCSKGEIGNDPEHAEGHTQNEHTEQVSDQKGATDKGQNE